VHLRAADAFADLSLDAIFFKAQPDDLPLALVERYLGQLRQCDPRLGAGDVAPAVGEAVEAAEPVGLVSPERRIEGRRRVRVSGLQRLDAQG
jgi:hypothetical protein